MTAQTYATPAPVMRYKTDRHDTTADTVTSLTMARRLPATLRQILRLGWRADRRALLGLVAAQAATAACAAAALTATTTVVSTLLRLLTAYTSGHASAASVRGVIPALTLVTAALAAAALTEAAARACAARLGPRCAREADLDVLQAAAGVELSAYEEPGFEDGLEAAGKGAEAARDVVQDAQSLISALAQMAAAVAVLSTLHPALVGLLLLAAVPRGWAAIKAARIEHTAARDALADNRLRAVLRGYSTDRNTAAEVRLFSMGGFLGHRYRQVADRLEADALTAALRGLRVQLGGDAASALTLAGTWCALAALVAGGQIPLAAAGTALVALRTSNTSLAAMMRATARVFRTGLFLDDWAGFLTSARRHRARRGTLTVPAGGPEVISARGLTYTYPGTSTPVLHDLDLDLKRGEIVALVGENGSGKTTLVHLLTGLYLPDAGSVTWDGVDIADADPASVWRHIAMVPQDYTRWPLTARENISLGTGLGDDTVRQAADAAGATAVLDRLPDGLDTSLARSWWGGHDLSGGQWQRIAIARAFARQAAFHVLDEPSAALDARAEHQVFTRLKTLVDGAGALFITHRLANARAADRIVVMHEGRVVQSGTYRELLREEGGLFLELHRMQEGDD